MEFAPLESVVLTHDVPECGLKAGDLGTIVEIYATNTFEIEFVTANSRTQALLTLHSSDVRKVGPHDMIAVRPAQPAA